MLYGVEAAHTHVAVHTRVMAEVTAARGHLVLVVALVVIQVTVVLAAAIRIAPPEALVLVGAAVVVAIVTATVVPALEAVALVCLVKEAAEPEVLAQTVPVDQAKAVAAALTVETRLSAIAATTTHAPGQADVMAVAVVTLVMEALILAPAALSELSGPAQPVASHQQTLAIFNQEQT